jgi:CcmD family protein
MSSNLALMSIQGYIFGAYTAAFVLLFAFLAVLFTRVRSIGRETEDLKEQVNRSREEGEG